MTKSEQLFQRACGLIPGGVNSPVRAFGSVGETPRFIKKADGPYMIDADGNQYLDYICSWGPMILGHNHPLVREKVTEASSKETLRVIQIRFSHFSGRRRYQLSSVQ